MSFRPSWLVWGAGVGVYFLAVFHRTSLGVAGPQAQERFGLTASQLSTFVMLQLGIYAAMQIPAGILIDKYGPRRMLLTATLIMGSAQMMFAFVPNYPLALVARGLLGCGDAMTYISVLRLVSVWFSARRYPIFTSFTGLVGVAGNLVATLPLTALLHGYGWVPTFAVAGAISLGYSVLLIRPARWTPEVDETQPALAAKSDPLAGTKVWQEVKSSWRHPAGRLGFWIHFTTMVGPNTFSVLWGFPYLTQALGYSPQAASSFLVVLVIGSLCSSLIVGTVLGRLPIARSPLALAVSTACILGWITLIAWPGGHPPGPVLVIVILIFSVGGPASTVAFMLARDYNPRHRISTATGLVNVGGFTGTVIAVIVVGKVLDLVEPGASVRSAEAFRWAFSGILLLTVFGLFRVIVWWLRTRSRVLMATARGEAVPLELHRHRFDLVSEKDLHPSQLPPLHPERAHPTAGEQGHGPSAAGAPAVEPPAVEPFAAGAPAVEPFAAEPPAVEPPAAEPPHDERPRT